jgi:hypothetical protein
MTQTHPITPPPPHLLKKFSAQAQAETKKRNGAGYLKTFATLCIEWALNSQPTPNDRQIRSSEITPPPELVQQCWDELRDQTQDLDAARAWVKAITLAYQAGADQELEACCAWLAQSASEPYINALRIARPKPPSLKEQALHELNDVYSRDKIDDSTYDTICRALEALPE